MKSLKLDKLSWALVNCHLFASEVVFWAVLKDFEFTVYWFTVPLNRRNTKQRTQNPPKWIKIPLLRQKDDNLPKGNTTFSLALIHKHFEGMPLQMKKTVNPVHELLNNNAVRYTNRLCGLPVVKRGSFEKEALENEDRSTKHPNLENEAPKTRKGSPQNSKPVCPIKTRDSPFSSHHQQESSTTNEYYTSRITRSCKCIFVDLTIGHFGVA